MFGRYLKNQVRFGPFNSTSAAALSEADKYPYAKKEKPVEPYFTPVDLSGQHNDRFHVGLTDEGICDVYNGNSMSETYASSTRVNDLVEVLDGRRGTVTPAKVDGVGKIAQKTFWLNIGDK